MATAGSQYTGDDCPYPAAVLDFLRLRGRQLNWTALDESYPCEVRIFWAEDMRPFVLFVRFLFSYLTLPVVFLGFLLNIVALRVLRSPPFRRTSLSVYQRALSVSDMLALFFTYALGYWRSHDSSFNSLFLESEILCRTHKVLVSMFPMTSQWLQTALTIERLLAVWRPMSYPQKSSRLANRVVRVVPPALAMVAITKWWFSGFEQYSAFEYPRCENSSHNTVQAVYVYVALSTYLPGTIIFICNAMLLLRLKRSNVVRRSLFADSSDVDRSERESNTEGAARTLLLFSLLYLMLQLPLGIVETVELYWDVALYPPVHTRRKNWKAYIDWLSQKVRLKWIRSLLFWLFQLSFVLNFVVYISSSRKFRAMCIELMLKWTHPAEWSAWVKSLVPRRMGAFGSRRADTRNIVQSFQTTIAKPIHLPRCDSDASIGSSCSDGSSSGIGIAMGSVRSRPWRKKSKVLTSPRPPCARCKVGRTMSVRSHTNHSCRQRQRSRIRTWATFSVGCNPSVKASHRCPLFCTNQTSASPFSSLDLSSCGSDSVFDDAVEVNSHSVCADLAAERDPHINEGRFTSESRPQRFLHHELHFLSSRNSWLESPTHEGANCTLGRFPRQSTMKYSQNSVVSYGTIEPVCLNR